MGQQPRLCKDQTSQGASIITLEGDFAVDHWVIMKEQIANLIINTPTVTLDFQKIGNLDTFGAWQLARLWTLLEKDQRTLSIVHCPPDDLAFLQELKDFSLPEEALASVTEKRQNPIEVLGETTAHGILKAFRILTFFGNVILALLHCIRHPSAFRVQSFIQHLDYTGVRALPIIGLVSLLIGVVLVYQGVSQLERFGAEIFTVNLLAVSILRELGILMTAIVVAGRSGSAFTAQIGFMKLNQELDAMKVLGLDPMQLLVIPRLLALMVVLPLLTVFCDIVALIGGAFMSMELINLSWSQFLIQLQSAIQPSTFWVGIVKAPVFAFIIALISCYEGLRVSGGAESVGHRTTRSVVESIFMVIVLNAFFSILFSILDV